MPLTITGPGAGLATVDAGGASRIFDSYGTTTISGLTITGGNVMGTSVGGGIRNGGLDVDSKLTVHDCVITGNKTTGHADIAGIYATR